MRSVVVILLLLAGAAALAMQVGQPVEVDTTPPSPWVRTVDGWERLPALTAEPIQRTAGPHPLLVAGFLGMASGYILLALDRRKA